MQCLFMQSKVFFNLVKLLNTNMCFIIGLMFYDWSKVQHMTFENCVTLPSGLVIKAVVCNFRVNINCFLCFI